MFLSSLQIIAVAHLRREILRYVYIGCRPFDNRSLSRRRNSGRVGNDAFLETCSNGTGFGTIPASCLFIFRGAEKAPVSMQRLPRIVVDCQDMIAVSNQSYTPLPSCCSAYFNSYALSCCNAFFCLETRLIWRNRHWLTVALSRLAPCRAPSA